MGSGTVTKFRGTKIAAITSYAVGGSITAISLANPAVVTQTAHGFVDQDVVLIAGVVGMTELNGKLFVVDSATANTYSLVGVSSLDYVAYASGGTAAKAVMSNYCNLTSYSADTGSTSETVTETICSTEVEPDFGLPDPGSVSIGYNLDEANAVQIAFENSRRNVSPMAVKITYPGASGKVMVDIGVVTQTGVSGAAGTPNWTGTATLRRTRNRVDALVTP